MYRCNKLNESRKAWDVIPHGGQIKTSLRQRLAHLLPVAPWQCKKALRLLIDVESNETEAYKYVSASQSAKNAKEMAVCWINLFGLQRRGVYMEEQTKYFVLKQKAVPEVLLKVVEAKKLIESERAITIQEATEKVGISRS